MKPSLRRGLSFIALLAACAPEGASDETVTIETEQQQLLSWEQYKSLARRTDVDGRTLYVAEWDLVFSDERALREHYDELLDAEEAKLGVFQRISDGFEPTFTFAEQVSLTYCVSNSFGTNKAAAIRDMDTATRGWEAVANLHFAHVPGEDATCDQNNNDVDFAVLPTTISGLYGCAASKKLWGSLGCPVPGAGDVRGVLLLNYGDLENVSGAWAGATPVGTLEHELGHMLGFRHEHPWAPAQGGCGEAVTVPFYDITGRHLTSYDQDSVMHYPNCDGNYGEDMSISPLDGVGARAVYGMPASWYVPVLAVSH
jgi:hypothetical protein